jgi:hypothetical protein
MTSIWEEIKRRFILRGPKYQPTFTKYPGGNGIKFGEELIVRIVGAEVVTGRIFDVVNRKTYQIDQSHAKDEDNDAETTNFTMKTKIHPDALPPDYFLPPGEYMLLTWWFDYDTMRGGTYRDKFDIIA